MSRVQALSAVLWVGFGGFLGAAGRYLLSLIPTQGEFPLMTFLANLMGAALIGAVVELSGRLPIPTQGVLFLKTGVCGGFTTFSTFSLETVTLMERGRLGTAGLYAASSVFGCLIGVLLGRLAARWVLSALR